MMATLVVVDAPKTTAAGSSSGWFGRCTQRSSLHDWKVSNQAQAKVSVSRRAHIGVPEMKVCMRIRIQ
jgi:hypothetical protein